MSLARYLSRLFSRRTNQSGHAMRDVNSMSSEELSNFLNGFDTVCADCDGVIYRAGNAIDGSPQLLSELARMGKRIVYVTNGSTRTREGYARKLAKLGCPFGTKEHVVHAGYLTAMYLKELGYEGKVFLAGEEGVQKEMTEAGYEFVTDGVILKK